ncbi:MAG: MgtC/SapB family protein [Clostridia bacterium]|nr:MgtC/SapB family protein [Clostridia bacterium]
MEFIRSITSTFEFEVVLRLLLGFLLAGIIGAERESENKPAGFKTHSLIGISAVLIMLCGRYYSELTHSDAARIPAQLLSGIGFIGAGTILRDGFNVKGLTTASSLLAVTCIGLSVGAGFYVGGIIATVIVYIILRNSHSFFGSIDHYYNTELHLKVEDYANTIITIQNILDKYDINIKKIKNNQKDEEHSKDVLLVFRYHKDVNINSVLAEISSLDDVTDLEQG